MELSAEVLLYSATGEAPNVPITSENLARFQPDPASQQQAIQAFQGLGFHVGTKGGLGFSITASSEQFERVYRARLQVSEQGGVTITKGVGREPLCLSLDALSADLKRLVWAVTFSEPPAFGPTSFF